MRPNTQQKLSASADTLRRGNRRPPFSLEQTTLARVETHTANLTYTPLPYTLSRQLRLSNPKEWT